MEESKREQFSKRLMGELVIGNSDCFAHINQEEINLLNGYYMQKLKSPNYPSQFDEKADIVMERLVRQVFNSYQPCDKKKRNGGFVKFFIILFCLSGIILAII